MEKLPSAHEINPAFEPIDADLGQPYQDPDQLHNMLIDERLHAQQQKIQELFLALKELWAILPKFSWIEFSQWNYNTY